MLEHFMLRNLLAMTIAAGTAISAFASEKAQEAPSKYRLQVENSRTFRLAAPAPETPAVPVRHALPDKPYAELIDRAARDASLDPALVHALIHVESRHNPAARSPKGAVGLMQVMPATAARYGVADATRSVNLNLSVGTRYLRDLLNLFGDRLDLALAAYNAGEHAVLRYGERIPPYPETRSYVPAVLKKYHEWREVPLATPAPNQRVQYLPGTVFESNANSGKSP